MAVDNTELIFVEIKDKPRKTTTVGLVHRLPARTPEVHKDFYEQLPEAFSEYDYDYNWRISTQ